MSSNPDPKTRAQELIFSRKSETISHPPLVFSNDIVQATSQKHLGIILDTRLSLKTARKSTM